MDAWIETIVMDNGWTARRVHFADGLTWTTHHFAHPTGTVPAIPGPSSITSNYPDLNTETADVTPCDWYD